jgi:1,4-dihydroxy-2-naphthoate octaprenyltransferase
LETGGFNGWYFALVLLGVALLHLGSNVMNDYFDVKDGTDELNTDYFQQYSGGSRAIELGLITLEGTKRVGLSLIGAALLIGIYLTYETGWTTFLIGLSGLAIGYFYTAPPVRLVARKGLGELGIALAFGPLITLGTVFVLTQELSWLAFLAGIPSGLLTANILLINEFPDAESDAKTGKNHLVVTFGKKASILIYLGIMLGAVGGIVVLNLSMPVANLGLWLVAGLTLLAGLYIVQQIRKNFDRRELGKSNVHTISLSALSSLAVALVIWLV